MFYFQTCAIINTTENSRIDHRAAAILLMYFKIAS